MNITLKCPGCGQPLAVPPDFAGRQATCPKCKSPFLIPVAPSPPAAKPLPVATPLAFPAAARSSTPPLPRSAPPPLPQSAGAHSAPHGGAFDLDSLGISPASAVSTAGIAPVPRSVAAGSRRSSKTPWLVGAIAASVFLLAAAVGGWMMFGVRSGLGDDLRFMPDDANLVFTIDVKSLLASGVGRRFKEQLPDLKQLAKNSKVKPEDIERMTMGGRATNEQFCVVIHFTKPIAVEDVLPGETTKSTVGSHTMYVQAASAATQIDPQSVLIGTVKEVRQVLERNAPPRIPAALEAAMTEADFSKPLAIAVDTSGVAQLVAGQGMANPMGATLQQIRGFSAYAQVGDDIRLYAAAVCKDSAAAENVRKEIEGLKAMVASVKPAAPAGQNAAAMNMMNSLSVSTSGATLRASLTIDADTLAGPIMAARAAANNALNASRTARPDNVGKPAKPRLHKPKKPKNSSDKSN